MERFKKIFVLFGSLLLTPVILFISTTSALYLRNQMDLGYSYRVLYPFLWLTVFAVALGLVLYWFSRFRLVRFMLWFYYAIGPFFLLYTPLRNLSVPFVETAIGFTFLICFSLGVFFVIASRFKHKSLVGFLAFLGFFFLFFEAYSFYTGFQSAPSGRTDNVYSQVQIDGDAEKLPNIYLLLLDGFQSDMFDLTITPEVKKTLGGFVYFHENTALFGRTGMSVPSIFGGRSYKFKGPQADYKEDSFTSGSSVPALLKDAGYANYAFVRDEINKYNDLSLFDLVVEHENEKGRYTPYSAFFGAWVFRNLPLFASTGILGAERLERIKNIDSLPRNASVSSYNGILRYLEIEKELPASNRFSFLYLLMPHIPYVFNDDCSFSSDMRDTGALSQSRCATSLIVKFIEKLKELGRFKDSMIIITADHGEGLRAEGGELKKIEGKLEWHRARSRALLLIKPAGSAGTEKLVTSEFQSSLLDIAPTIAASLAKTPGVNFEGSSLLNPALPLSARKKYYYFFEKKGALGWTDEMSRFIIEDNRIRADGVVKIENNGESSVARNNIGDFLLAQGRADEAIAEFRKALSLDPGFVKARGNLAKALTSLGRYDEAIAQYKTLLAKEPSNSITLQNIGINYTLQGRFKEAIENFERSTELNPSDSYAFYNYALALEGLKKVDEAESAYLKAIELNSREVNSRVNLANILVRRNDLEGALALYMEVVGLDPAHALALNNLGIIMNIKKRHVESLKFYERAIEADPGYVSAYYNMGITLEDLGRKSEALERYKEAVRIAPDYADVRESLAMIYMKEGLYLEASNEFKALLRIDPQNKKAAKGLEEAQRLFEERN